MVKEGGARGVSVYLVALITPKPFTASITKPHTLPQFKNNSANFRNVKPKLGGQTLSGQGWGGWVDGKTVCWGLK